MMALVPAPVRNGEAPASDDDLRALYRSQRTSLLRLATLLLHDEREAEEVVQDAFVRAHLAWPRLRDAGKGPAYLRSAVLNGARSRLRHLRVVRRRDRHEPTASGRSAEAEALASEDHHRMVELLRSLPTRQRECLVLRFYLDLSEAEIAATLGISAGSVKTHVHRGLATLATRLPTEDRS